MVSFQPVLLALFALSGLAYECFVQGPQLAGRSLLWQLPLVVIIALLNPVFSAAGSTELFRMFNHAFYLESLVYGFSMGLMLLAVFKWFGLASCVLTSDKVMLLFGRIAPTVGLLLTMTMRLVPQFVRRGAVISQTRAACTAAGEEEGKFGSLVRQSTVLMSWGMEDSLETSDAMRARGWSREARRTSYSRKDFRFADGVACGLLAVLILLCAICLVVSVLKFQFYPVLGPWPDLWAYAPFVALLAVPLYLEVANR